MLYLGAALKHTERGSVYPSCIARCLPLQCAHNKLCVQPLPEHCRGRVRPDPVCRSSLAYGWERDRRHTGVNQPCPLRALSRRWCAREERRALLMYSLRPTITNKLTDSLASMVLFLTRDATIHNSITRRHLKRVKKRVVTDTPPSFVPVRHCRTHGALAF